VIRKVAGALPRIRLGMRLTPEDIDKFVEQGAVDG
jgi:hypothetical protein